MSFQELNIIDPILASLAKEGYSEPTPIQRKAIPPLLEGRDLLGCAQTGTGKTAAFAIPILQLLQREKRGGGRPIRALVLTPTRELAAQIGSSFAAYGANLRLKSTVIFGGVSQNAQVRELGGGVDILVATPGRLLDLMGQKLVDLTAVGYFVLDEADRMLDMGFLHDVERVIAALPKARQTMLFSATMPPEIERLTRSILKDPVKAAVTPVSSTVDSIEQSVYFVNKGNKTRLLLHLLEDPAVESALVFSRTKHGANKIAKELDRAGIPCDVIHANKAQNARQAALQRFKTRRSRVLVATDIVSRGIDIDELSHVFNYNLPEVPEAYVHRIGRTGRAGLGGTAISFCDETEIKLLRAIEKLIGKTVPVIKEHPYPLVRQPEAPAPEKERRPSGEAPAQNKPRSGRRRNGGRSYSGAGSSSGGRPAYKSDSL